MSDFASYYKCALQVNSFSYSKYRGKKENNEDQYNQQIADLCKANNISIVGLADHGSVDATQSLRDKLIKEGITVFPGFEISTAEKMHIVCLFSPESSNSELNQYLGALGLSKAKTGTEPSTLTCLEIAEKIKDLGGFWYAAHIIGENGILYIGKLHHIWKNENLIAAQIPELIENVDPKYKNIINNTDPEYKREKAIAYINAKDIEQPEDLNNPSSSFLVKMSSPNFNNFKVAFSDPDSRIRLNYEREKSYQSSIDHITVSGGYLDGLDLDISENLSTIIGGRGTGKSTLINIIRYVMDCEPIGTTAQNDFKDMIKQNLGSNSRVEIRVTSYEQYGNKYTISRRFNQNPVISDISGNVLQLSTRDLFPSIEIYGQNEIMEIARDNNRILHVANRLLNLPNDIKNELSETHDKLVENGKELMRLYSEREANISSLEDLPSLVEKLKYYESAGLKDKLSLFKQLSTEEGQFEGIRQSLNTKSIVFPKIELGDYKNEYLILLSKEIESFNHKMDDMKTQYEKSIENLNKAFEDYYKKWEINKSSYDEKLKKSLKEIPDIQDKSRKDIVEEYTTINKQVEASKPLDEKQKAIDASINILILERKNIIESFKKACDKRDSQLSKLIKSINKKKLNGIVRITIKYRQNKGSIIDKLCAIEGLGEKRLNGILEYEDFDVITFVEDINSGIETLHEKYNLTKDACEKIINGLDNNDLLEIEQIILSDTIDIELKVGDKYKKLKELSKGQQCTAILNLLLIDNVDPLIIDQPEDNLDNSYIAENLVNTIRENKIKRQYIFATHNANIPVFGDSEQIITMEENDGNGNVSKDGLGSIDDLNVRNKVISILEGGQKAFKMREIKYGL